MYQVEVRDTLAPTLSAPSNKTLEFMEDALGVTFNATDFSALSSWFVDDTTSFSIDSSGAVVNITELVVGTYIINVSINDTYNNIGSTLYKVTVQDTVYPTWSSNKTNASNSVKYEEAFLNLNILEVIKIRLGPTNNFKKDII